MGTRHVATGKKASWSRRIERELGAERRGRAARELSLVIHAAAYGDNCEGVAVRLASRRDSAVKRAW